MKLDERFKQLNELPQDDQLKQRIRISIEEKQQKTPFSLNKWKEISLIIGICFIGLFLLITSSNELKNQAASDEIKGIYSYHNVSGEGFRGRASTLFIGVKNITTDKTVFLFENIDELEPVKDTNIGTFEHYDIIVVKNGEKHRYELSENYLYDVENQLYYPGYMDYPMALRADLLNAHDDYNGLLTFFIPFSVVLLHLIATAYYKRRNVKPPEKFRGMGVVITIALVVLLAIGGYVFYLGPLYRPLLFLLAVIYGFLIWWTVKRNVTNLIVLKVERWRAIAIVLVIFGWIVMY